MAFEGSRQWEMLNAFSKKYSLSPDYKLYAVEIGNKWALYRGSNPNRIRNNKLNKVSYRWEWKNPLGGGPGSSQFEYVILHGMSSKNAKETVFVVDKKSLGAQAQKYPGQREKVSLDTDTTPGARHNKRTEFYFPLAKGPAEFKAWLKRFASS